MRTWAQHLRLALALAATASLAVIAWSQPGSAATASPIQHVVVIYQENHSFNDVLGWLCDGGKRCEGTDARNEREQTRRPREEASARG